jgi:signal transduction histidine kinase/CheY-like chemotaxis protein
MKTRFSYFFWIIALALGLMLLIYLAQLFTNRNVAGLQKGNRDAAITFSIQNSLQEIINIVFSLESRLTGNKIAKENLSGIKDSLTLIGYNTSVLSKLSIDTVSKSMFEHLNNQVSELVFVSQGLVDAIGKDDKEMVQQYTDSIIALRKSDEIYNTAIKITKLLENKLQNTLIQNTLNSRNLSTYNKILALIAIAAILILATIIINRHLRQLQLIGALEKANTQVNESAFIKEQFLANMSHEIRTPLNAIIGFSGILNQSNLTTEQKQYADVIENASNQLLIIVNDVLDISKIEAGKLQIESKELNLKNILQLFEFMFGNIAREKKLIYEWGIDDDTPLDLIGDTDRLNQILSNLISNAIKFTKAGFIKINARELKRTDKKTWIQFKIEDSGTGISSDNTDRVFERFYQVTNNDGSLIKGTGLGLAIVKNLSDLMGGDVTLESQAGRGSLFYVTLPFEINSNPEKSKENKGYYLLKDLQFRNAKILVAEDNRINQLLLKYLLNKYGIDPVFRSNGKDVIETVQQETFDLLLMDIQMPVLNGYQTMERIKELNLELPVVAMTAYVMAGDKEKCLAAGMNDYISKPISEVELQQVLVKFLAQKQHSRNKIVREDIDHFLINLAGGDNEMAIRILLEVKKELAVELQKFEELKFTEPEINKLKGFCHHLISTISPLGTDTPSMKCIKNIQQTLSSNFESGEIRMQFYELKRELETLQRQLEAS